MGKSQSGFSMSANSLSTNPHEASRYLTESSRKRPKSLESFDPTRDARLDEVE
jgi:hypothetical protein